MKLQTCVASPSRAKKASRLARLGKKLLLLLGGLIVAALLSEGLVLMILGEQPKFPRHVVPAPWGLRQNQPNTNYRHKSADMTAWFHINGQGMRADRDYAYDKPPGMKRIISLGDSFTIGYEVSDQDCFNSVLERNLNSSGIRCEVLNAGVSGFGNSEECLYLERELFKYQPDLVLVSFYSGNDLDDNVRSDLFRLKDGKLVVGQQNYVPGGRLGNLLNTNPILSWLSERSNAFAFVKERMTGLLKKDLEEKNEQALHLAPSAAATQPTSNFEGYSQKLCVAVMDRIYEDCHSRGIPLVIQTIPFENPATGQLVDLFPKSLDANRPGLYLISDKDLLTPFLGKQKLYWTRSHRHWTPFSHLQSGNVIAKLILENGLLR